MLKHEKLLSVNLTYKMICISNGCSFPGSIIELLSQYETKQYKQRNVYNSSLSFYVKLKNLCDSKKNFEYLGKTLAKL